MRISVVIPTCNRKQKLLLLLNSLNASSYPLEEVIIVDSGEDRLEEPDYSAFQNLHIEYLSSQKSVCIQRNIGINKARSEWVFLCDDDIEVPGNYLEKLAEHSHKHGQAGALSGLFLQKVENNWQAKYPVTSGAATIWHYIFQLSLWGEITSKDNIFTRKVKRYYKQKGNNISKAGWPVNVDFSGDFFTAPVYSLGASLVKKEWLIHSPFDEVLDTHGIGENYGVMVDFPSYIHVLNGAFVYHHKAQENRLQKALQYYRRGLALDYFRKTKPDLRHVKKHWFVWSLFGNLLMLAFSWNAPMVKASFRLMWKVFFNQNPYYWGALKKKKVVQPTL